MAQKINPNTLRLGLTVPWANRWFLKKNLRIFLEEDHLIREFIRKRILAAGISAIEIERTAEQVRIFIKASRPGLIIGRGGKGIEELKDQLIKQIKKWRVKNKLPVNFKLNLDIVELKRTEISASVVAQQIAFDLEKRQSYRRVIKRHLDMVSQNREVRGAKIKVAGRLDGAEISRRAWVAKGRMPLQTLRANIDYGEATAFNSYGTVGIKVWIYKGDIFDKATSQ